MGCVVLPQAVLASPPSPAPGVSAPSSTGAPEAPAPATTATGGPSSDEARALAEAEAREAARLAQLRAEYEALGPDANEHGVPKSYVGQLIQTVFMLVAVCALAYLVLGKLVPRLLGMTAAGRRALVATPSQGVLHVVDRLPLDPRRSLMVVRVGDEHFLVGLAEQSMTMLARLDDTRFDVTPPTPTPSVLGSFGRLLERRMDKEGG
jgi:flagellar protein FliO/FliZ